MKYLDDHPILGQKMWDDCVTGLAIVGKDGKFLDANPMWCQTLKYTHGEICDKFFKDITHPEDIDADFEELEQCILRKIDNYDMRKRYITKMGDIMWVDLHVETIVDDNDEIIFFLSQIQVPTKQTINAELIEKILRKEAAEEVAATKIPVDDSKFGFIKSIIEKNFKWLATVLVASLAYTGNTIYKVITVADEYQDTKGVVEQNSQQIEENNENIKEILELLRNQNNDDTP